MGAERSQWQFPANEVGKVIGWSDEASPSNPNASKGLVNKGPFVESDDTIVRVDTRVALKALETTDYTTAYLTESGREGVFVWRSGDYTARIAADTLEGVFVKAGAIASSAGAWVRQYDGALRVEWFGAAPNSATDSQPAFEAAYDLLIALDAASEGPMGKIEAPGSSYTFASSWEVSKPFILRVDGYIRYTPTSGSAIVVGATIPVSGRNTGYDFIIYGGRSVNGNLAAPTGYNAAGTSFLEIRNAQFSNFRVGRIIAFTKAGFWGNQTNDVYALQHCQDNTIWLGDVAYCGEGVRIESVDAALGAFQVNEVHVQNSFGNWTNFRVGGTGDNNSNNNIFWIVAMDADTGGGAGFIRGLYNDFQFGYANGTVALQSGSAYNRLFAQVGEAQVVFTDAGTRNEIKRAVEGWTTPNSSTPPIVVESTDATANGAELIKLKRRSASPAANDGGPNVGFYFHDDGGTERKGVMLATDMPTVEAGGNRNMRAHMYAMIGGTLTLISSWWQGMIVGAGASDQGVGTLNVQNRIYQMGANQTPYRLQGTATFDPASLADGAGVTTTVTVTGAALGDVALASFSLDTSGITITAWVSATNTVSVRFQNESGGVLDIGSGTLKAWVLK